MSATELDRDCFPPTVIADREIAIQGFLAAKGAGQPWNTALVSSVRFLRHRLLPSLLLDSTPTRILKYVYSDEEV
jgi:hypothetical protein